MYFWTSCRVGVCVWCLCVCVKCLRLLAELLKFTFLLVIVEVFFLCVFAIQCSNVITFYFILCGEKNKLILLRIFIFDCSLFVFLSCSLCFWQHKKWWFHNDIHRLFLVEQFCRFETFVFIAFGCRCWSWKGFQCKYINIQYRKYNANAKKHIVITFCYIAIKEHNWIVSLKCSFSFMAIK